MKSDQVTQHQASDLIATIIMHFLFFFSGVDNHNGDYLDGKIYDQNVGDQRFSR